VAQNFAIESDLTAKYGGRFNFTPQAMDVLAAIPHRPPFLFVDKVTFCDGENIIAERTWRPEEDFYKGHYPNNPITPGVLICESIFQTAAIMLSERVNNDAENIVGASVPVLARIVNCKFKRMVKPGEKTVASVSLKEKLNGFYFLDGKMTVEGKTALTIEFALTLVDQKAAR